MDPTRELLVKGRHWSGDTWVVRLPTEEAKQLLRKGAPFIFTTQNRIGEATRNSVAFVDCYFIPFPNN